jgi:hypothetical protein
MMSVINRNTVDRATTREDAVPDFFKTWHGTQSVVLPFTLQGDGNDLKRRGRGMTEEYGQVRSAAGTISMPASPAEGW